MVPLAQPPPYSFAKETGEIWAEQRNKLLTKSGQRWSAAGLFPLLLHRVWPLLLLDFDLLVHFSKLYGRVWPRHSVDCIFLPSFAVHPSSPPLEEGVFRQVLWTMLFLKGFRALCSYGKLVKKSMNFRNGLEGWGLLTMIKHYTEYYSQALKSCQNKKKPVS